MSDILSDDPRQSLMVELRNQIVLYAQNLPHRRGIIELSRSLLAQGITFDDLQREVLEIFTTEFINSRVDYFMDQYGWLEVSKMVTGTQINMERSKAIFPEFWKTRDESAKTERDMFKILQDKRDYFRHERKKLGDALEVNMHNFFTSSR